MRLRRTAFPTMRAAIANPRRGTLAPVFRANIAKKASAERRASRYTRSNSDFCRRRCAGWNGRAGDKQVAMEPAARSARSGSDSETLATFRAAPGENLTAGSRRHPGAKTVGALTMQVAGLIRTLHCWLSLLSSGFFRRMGNCESCVKTSTCRGGKKGGKGTQRLPQCQAKSKRRGSERSLAQAVDNPRSIGIDSPSFRVARAEQFFDRFNE